MTTALVLDALNMAAWTRRHPSLDGLICHTDAGTEYTSVLYTDRIDEVTDSAMALSNESPTVPMEGATPPSTLPRTGPDQRGTSS